jgi:hypothetical protein
MLREGGGVRIRAVHRKRDGDLLGPYYQIVDYKRDPITKRQRVNVHLHLGKHETPQAALEAWRREVKELESAHRPRAAKRLREKLERLEALMSEDKGKREEQGNG